MWVGGCCLVSPQSRNVSIPPTHPSATTDLFSSSSHYLIALFSFEELEGEKRGREFGEGKGQEGEGGFGEGGNSHSGLKTNSLKNVGTK